MSFSSERRSSEQSWLSGIQRDLIVECDSVRAGCAEVKVQLKELSKFADDDWGTTADDYVKVGKQIDNRKRKLAQSLVMVMNTQDVTPGFNALPPLETHSEGYPLAQRRRAEAGIVMGSSGQALLDKAGEEKTGGGAVGSLGKNAGAIGGAPAESRLDEQGVALAIEEFKLRIKDLDAIKRKMGEVLPSDALAVERERQKEAAARLAAMRERLRWGGRFELYLFEEDEIARGEAFRRWKVCLTVVAAMVRLQAPLRRHARSRRNWRRALNVASALNRFKREGEIKRERVGDLARVTGGEGEYAGYGEGEETYEEPAFDDAAADTSEAGSGAGRGSARFRSAGAAAAAWAQPVPYQQPAGMAPPQKAMGRRSVAGRGKGGKGKGKGKGDGRASGVLVPPGWVAPPDIEEKTAAYERAQQARVNWRRAIGAAKCISRMRQVPKELEDEDAQFEFQYEETWAEVEDARSGERKIIPIVRTELVDTVTGRLKVMATSNFNAGREKEQRDELKGTPAGPGVSNLLFAVQKRPDNDPKDMAAAMERQRQEKEAKMQADDLQLQSAMMLQQMQQQLGGGSGGGTTFVTAAQFKEAERQKQLAKERAEEEEKRRLEDEEKNFSYVGTSSDVGLSWHELHRSGRVGGTGQEEHEDISPLDVAPEDQLRFIIWENVRSTRFEAMIFVAILANCVQLALYDPEVDLELSGSALFAPPWTPYKIFEIIFMFLFPIEAALKVYAYQWAYFGDFWNKIDFFCVLLIFVNLVPGLPNLTVIRTLRMLKPLRSISKLPTLKVIVITLVRSAQQIIDVYVICFFVFMVFAVLAMDLFGGAFAQTCLSIRDECVTNTSLTESECPPGDWETVVEKQPDELTSPLLDRRCGVYECEEGYTCYLGNGLDYNPEGGNQSFDNIGVSLLTVFIFVTRRGWVRILSRLWDTYGYFAPTVISLVLMMFGSYLLTQLITAAITVTYEKVDDEMILEIQKLEKQYKLSLNHKRPEDEDSESSDDSDDDGMMPDPSGAIGPDGKPVMVKKKKKDPYKIGRKSDKPKGLLGRFGFNKKKGDKESTSEKKEEEKGDGDGGDQQAGASGGPPPSLAAGASSAASSAMLASGTSGDWAGAPPPNPNLQVPGALASGPSSTIGGAPAITICDDEEEDKHAGLSGPRTAEPPRPLFLLAASPAAPSTTRTSTAAAAATAAMESSKRGGAPESSSSQPLRKGCAQERRQRRLQRQQLQLVQRLNLAPEEQAQELCIPAAGASVLAEPSSLTSSISFPGLPGSPDAAYPTGLRRRRRSRFSDPTFSPSTTTSPLPNRPSPPPRRAPRRPLRPRASKAAFACTDFVRAAVSRLNRDSSHRRPPWAKAGAAQAKRLQSGARVLAAAPSLLGAAESTALTVWAGGSGGVRSGGLRDAHGTATKDHCQHHQQRVNERAVVAGGKEPPNNKVGAGQAPPAHLWQRYYERDALDTVNVSGTRDTRSLTLKAGSKNLPEGAEGDGLNEEVDGSWPAAEEDGGVERVGRGPQAHTPLPTAAWVMDDDGDSDDDEKADGDAGFTRGELHSGDVEHGGGTPSESNSTDRHSERKQRKSSHRRHRVGSADDNNVVATLEPLHPNDELFRGPSPHVRVPFPPPPPPSAASPSGVHWGIPSVSAFFSRRMMGEGSFLFLPWSADSNATKMTTTRELQVKVVGGAPGEAVTDSGAETKEQAEGEPGGGGEGADAPSPPPPPPPPEADAGAKASVAAGPPRLTRHEQGDAAEEERRQELLRAYQANPLMTNYLMPKRGRLYEALYNKFCVHQPKWMRWRGFRPLRKVTRNPLFDQILYLAILLNMYALTFSDVRTSSCIYKYDVSNDQDEIGKAYTLQLTEMLANSNMTVSVPAGATLDGECIRGAKLLDVDTTLGAVPPGDPKYMIALAEQINDLCSLVFLLELLLRFGAHGFKYMGKTFNQFDALVVAACVIDIWVPLPGASAARFFRIANIVAKTTRLESLRKIVDSIFNSLGPLSGVVSLAFLMLFVFAVGGLQLYGLNLPGEDRINFRDFPHSMLTVFILFTGDGWSQIMYKIMYEEGAGNCAFFVFFTIYGMFGLSMLILATLISKFDCGSRDDFKLSAVLPVKDAVDEVRRLIQVMRKGGKRAQQRRERELADMRRRGLLQEKEEESKAAKEETPEEEKARLKKMREEDEARTAKEKKKKLEAEKEKKEDNERVVTAHKSAREAATEAAKVTYFIQAEHTLIKEHPSVLMKRNALATQEQIIIDSMPEELTGSIGYGFCRIEHDSAIREKFLSKIVDQPKFEGFIMFCIILSCAMLAYEGPGMDDDDPMKTYFEFVDLAFLGIFVVECLMRIMHKGLLFTNVAYLKDPWNQLDFFIVVSDVVSTVFQNVNEGFTNFRALRGFRALRPLRALKKAPELRAVVDVIANTLPVFINIALCSLIFYAVGGVFMMKFFAGRFWRCNDPAVTKASDCGGFFDASPYARPNNDYLWPNTQVEWSKEWDPVVLADDGVTMLTARRWYNAPRNFDSTSAAMLTIFEMSTLDHWVEILFLCMDSAEKPGETSAVPGERYGFALLVIFLVIIGNYLLMNLLVCGVVMVYDKLKPDSRDNDDLTRGQRELLDALQLMLRTRPGYRQTPPDELDAMPFQMLAYKVVMFDRTSGSKKLEDQRGTTFELVISGLVVLNTGLLALYSYQTPQSGSFIAADHTNEIAKMQDTDFRLWLNYMNDAFSALFLLEMLLKIYAFSFIKYWRENWNKFDFIVVLSGLFQTFIDGFMGLAIIPTSFTTQAESYLYFDPNTMRVLRVVRLVRVVRLLKGLAKYDRIQSITQLVDTLSNCIKHIINVFGLWLLVTVTFALIAMSIFGDIPFKNQEYYKYGVYNEHNNFSSFSQALVSLFKVATLDDWSWLMRDVMAGQKSKGEFPFGWVFFVVYLVVTAFLFLNIFTAIVMDQYDFTARVTSKPRSNGLTRQVMTFNQASVISEEWSYLDPKKTDFIDDSKVRKLLFKIGYPVGYKEGCDRSIQLRHLRRMELRMTGMSRQVHYVDFFISCALMRYRQQRKPTADIDLKKVRGKLSLAIQLAFPSIMDNRLEDSGGLISAVQAVEYLQVQYRGLILRRMMAAGDKEGLQNYSENRQRAMERQEQMRRKEDEAAEKAARKAAASSKKPGGKSKKK